MQPSDQVGEIENESILGLFPQDFTLLRVVFFLNSLV